MTVLVVLLDGNTNVYQNVKRIEQDEWNDSVILAFRRGETDIVVNDAVKIEIVKW